MFGVVRAHIASLSEEETKRYRAVYCGLCRQLGKRFGLRGRVALTYDLTFLTLLLSSLYEPEEEMGEERCSQHPAKPHLYAVSSITDYAADMTIALTYFKCLDDWQDEHKHTRKMYADALEKPYQEVKARWPEQTDIIERSMKELSEVEVRHDPSPDHAADCFGRLMAGLFLMKRDWWSGALATFGMSLGRFIYMADAACDFDEDSKSGSYNPVVLMEKQPEDMREILKQILGDASIAFEGLPLVRDEHLLGNILYSGIWQSYNEAMQKRKDGNKHG